MNPRITFFATNFSWKAAHVVEPMRWVRETAVTTMLRRKTLSLDT